MSRIHSFIRFLFVGGLNTAVDFSVLNILLVALGTHPTTYVFIKGVAFTVAVTNSYFWNHYWVFASAEKTNSRAARGISFLSISLIGLAFNVLISSIVFVVLGHIAPTLSPILSANIGAVMGSIFVLLFNYTGYKRFVFS